MAKAKAKPQYTETKDGIVIDLDAVDEAMLRALNAANEEDDENAKKPPFYVHGEGMLELVTDDHLREFPTAVGAWAKRAKAGKK